MFMFVLYCCFPEASFQPLKEVREGGDGCVT